MGSVTLSTKIDSNIKELLDKLSVYTGLQKKDIIGNAILEFVKNHYPELLDEDAKKIIEEKTKEAIKKAINISSEDEEIKNTLLLLLDVVEEIINTEAMWVDWKYIKSNDEYESRLLWDDETLKHAYYTLKRNILKMAFKTHNKNIVMLISLIEKWLIWWGYRQYVINQPDMEDALLNIYKQKFGDKVTKKDKYLNYILFGSYPLCFIRRGDLTEKEKKLFKIIHQFKKEGITMITKQIIKQIRQYVQEGVYDYNEINKKVTEIFETMKEKVLKEMQEIELKEG